MRDVFLTFVVMDRTSLAWGSALMALGVALGAFGAHGLKAVLSAAELAQWHTGVHYHFIHALGLLLLAGYADKLPKRTIIWVRAAFLIGILLFSGSLYLLSTRTFLHTEALTPILGPITPFGGLLFISGWVLLLITTLHKKDQR